jgi:hypothetical protein
LLTEPLQSDRSLSDLFHDLTSDVSLLFRKEIELAKVEAREELKRSGRAGAMFAGAALGGWLAALFLSLAAAWLLDQAMNTALAFAIVGVIWAVTAMVLAQRAKRQVAGMQPLPQTMETVKEDVQWVKTRNN